MSIPYKNRQFYKFSAYGFLKNLRLFDAFLLLYLKEIGFSYTQIGLLYAIRHFSTNLSEIPSGIVADTYGRKSSLIVSFSLFIISFLLYYFSSSLISFAIAMLLYGLADAFRSGSNKAMMMQYLEEHGWKSIKVDYYGGTRAWSQIGSAISSLLGAGVVFFSGQFKLIFLLSVLPYVLNLLNVWSYPSNLNMPKEPNQEKLGLKDQFQNLVSAFKNWDVIRIVNTSALYSSFLSAVKDYLQVILFSLPFIAGLDLMNKSQESKGGLVIGVVYFFIFLLNSWASKNAKRLNLFGARKTANATLILGFLSGVMIGIFTELRWGILSVLGFFILYFIQNLRKPILTAAVSEETDEKVLTSVLSVQSSYNTLLSAILAFLLGYLVDSLGIGMGILGLSSALLILALILIYLPRAKKRSIS